MALQSEATCPGLDHACSFLRCPPPRATVVYRVSKTQGLPLLPAILSSCLTLRCCTTIRPPFQLNVERTWRHVGYPVIARMTTGPPNAIPGTDSKCQTATRQSSSGAAVSGAVQRHLQGCMRATMRAPNPCWWKLLKRFLDPKPAWTRVQSHVDRSTSKASTVYHASASSPYAHSDTRP